MIPGKMAMRKLKAMELARVLMASLLNSWTMKKIILYIGIAPNPGKLYLLDRSRILLTKVHSGKLRILCMIFLSKEWC